MTRSEALTLLLPFCSVATAVSFERGSDADALPKVVVVVWAAGAAVASTAAILAIRANVRAWRRRGPARQEGEMRGRESS